MKTGCNVDYTIVCEECGKLLRDASGKDIEEIHTARNLADVCADCCDVCPKYKEIIEETRTAIGLAEAARFDVSVQKHVWGAGE